MIIKIRSDRPVGPRTSQVSGPFNQKKFVSFIIDENWSRHPRNTMLHGYHYSKNTNYYVKHIPKGKKKFRTELELMKKSIEESEILL